MLAVECGSSSGHRPHISALQGRLCSLHSLYKAACHTAMQYLTHFKMPISESPAAESSLNLVLHCAVVEHSFDSITTSGAIGRDDWCCPPCSSFWSCAHQPLPCPADQHWPGQQQHLPNRALHPRLCAPAQGHSADGAPAACARDVRAV